MRIDARHVEVRAAGHQILDNIDLHVEAGRHVAIVGASGAGKSTLVGMLLGWHPPAAGELLVDEDPLSADRLDPVLGAYLGGGLVGEGPGDGGLQLVQAGVAEALQRADHGRVAGARLGAELVALINEKAFLHLEAPPVRVTGWDTPFPYTLENEYLPLSHRILPALLETLRGDGYSEAELGLIAHGNWRRVLAAAWR